MSLENESTKISQEEIEKGRQEALSHLSDLMTVFYHGLKTGEISKETVAEKEKAIDRFTGSMYSKNLNLTDYKLYYILMDMNIPEGVTEFDTPSMFGPLGAGEIETFIETNFKRTK